MPSQPYFDIISSMRNYELTFVLSAKLTKDDQDKILTKVKKLVAEAKGKIGEIKEWGKRELAYPVLPASRHGQKEKEGFFFTIFLELEGNEAKLLENKIKVEEDVLRHLLVRKE